VSLGKDPNPAQTHHPRPISVAQTHHPRPISTAQTQPPPQADLGSANPPPQADLGSASPSHRINHYAEIGKPKPPRSSHRINHQKIQREERAQREERKREEREKKLLQMRRKEKNKSNILRYGRQKEIVFLMDTKYTVAFQNEKLLYTLYPKLEFKEQFRGLLEQLSLFYCLFVEIESGFRGLLELLLWF
jgi:hypothetical protein